MLQHLKYLSEKVRRNPLGGMWVCLVGIPLLFNSCLEGTTSGTETGKGISLRGRVLDKDGAPVAGVVARLSLTNLADTTDSQGRYQITRETAGASAIMGIAAVDTMLFLQGGSRVASLDVFKWIDSLPDIRLTQRGFSGKLLATDTTIGKVEAVLSGTGIPLDQPIKAEFFYNQPVNEYSGYVFFPTVGKDAQYTIYVKVFNAAGLQIGQSDPVQFNGLAGNITIPTFNPTNVRILARLGNDTALAPGDTLKLDGSASFTPPGTKIVEYAWKVSGDTGFTAFAGGEFSFILPQPFDTNYSVTLRIKNDAQAVSFDAISIKVISRLEFLTRSPWKKIADSLPSTIRTYKQAVIFKNKIWLLGGAAPDGTLLNEVWSSDDGIVWSLATKTAPIITTRLFNGQTIFSSATAVVFKDTLWLLGGDLTSAHIWYSTDGAEWISNTGKTTFTPREGLSAVVFQQKLWVVGGRDTTHGAINDVWSSENGLDWELVSGELPIVAAGAIGLIVFENLIWASFPVIVGNYLNNTSDGIKWAGVAGGRYSNFGSPVVFEGCLLYMGSGVYFDSTPGLKTVNLNKPTIDSSGLYFVFGGKVWCLSTNGVWTWGD